jgi:hypothetical protein
MGPLSFAKFVKPSKARVEVAFVELVKEVVAAHEPGNPADAENSDLPYFLKPVKCLKHPDVVKLAGASFNEASEQKGMQSDRYDGAPPNLRPGS